MTEIAKYTQQEAQQETTPEKSEVTAAGMTAPEIGFSFIRSMFELWYSRLTDSDEELAKEKSIIEQLLLRSDGHERRRLREKLKPIVMEQRFRKDPEATRVFEQWKEVQYRAMDEYTAWEKEIKEKYGDEELRRRILAGEAPEYEYKPGEEELWYKLMRIEVEEGLRPESMLRFVKAVEDAGGHKNWERQLQEQLDKELGSSEHTLSSDGGISTTVKKTDIQQELKTLSPVHQEPKAEQ